MALMEFLSFQEARLIWNHCWLPLFVSCAPSPHPISKHPPWLLKSVADLGEDFHLHAGHDPSLTEARIWPQDPTAGKFFISPSRAMLMTHDPWYPQKYLVICIRVFYRDYRVPMLCCVHGYVCAGGAGREQGRGEGRWWGEWVHAFQINYFCIVHYFKTSCHLLFPPWCWWLDSMESSDYR